MPRVIYSLVFELEPTPDGQLRQLVAPLDRDGQAPFARPEPPKQRTIDIRAGDYLLHKGERMKVLDVAAYRDGFWEGTPESKDGYIVPEKK